MYKDYRLYVDFNQYLRYKLLEKNGKKHLYAPFPPNQKISALDILKATQLARNLNEFSFYLKKDDEKFDFLKIHLIEAKKQLKKDHPNTKFVVIVYNDKRHVLDSKQDGYLYTHSDKWKKRWTELEGEGIQVINFDTKEYKFLIKRLLDIDY